MMHTFLIMLISFGSLFWLVIDPNSTREADELPRHLLHDDSTATADALPLAVLEANKANTKLFHT